jgi:hypothetical protein
MTEWRAVRARQVLAACSEPDGARCGNAGRTTFWSKRDDLISCSHFTTEKKLGQKMLARIARHTGWRAEDL